MANELYNPLDKSRLGESVTRALLARPVVVLPPPEPFSGAGIYTLYYTGDFPAYRRIAEKNTNGRWAAPIYVGKAVPPGSRKGGYDLGESPGHVLYKRLSEHAESIQHVKNLSSNDFKCRYLVVDDIWIPLGESLLISMYSPLWNQVVEGFGIHNPGKNRPQKLSAWDVIHPGRPWTTHLKPHPRSEAEILKKIADFLNEESS